ncbi:MAG: hypothetical protein VKJ24_13855 [Synechococcales bacterium]|nr:hypothetical protein [Synechococcales bacterium]
MLTTQFPPRFFYSRRFQLAIAIPLTLILCSMSAIARSQRFLQPYSPTVRIMNTNAMNSKTATQSQPSLTRIQIIAQDHRENWGSGQGIRPTAPATVHLLLQVQNPTTDRQTLLIEQITIQTQQAAQAVFVAQPKQAIALQSLENTVEEIRLSLPQGLNPANPVQAIVQYRVGEQTYQMTSDFVAVDRR